MRAIKNPGVVYSGLVGANMNIRKPRPSRACRKAPRLCENGPMAGETLWFGDATFTSAIFSYRGKTGRYINGKWHAA